MEDIKDMIRKYALQNAIRFDGKANPKAIIGKVLGQDPKLKKDMKSLLSNIKEIVDDVNKESLEDQKSELEKIAPDLLEDDDNKNQKKELKLLKGDTKNIVMRFSPSPSGPMHLGHAYVLSLNSEYCKKYDGKLILRIEDTNPENIYEPAYKLLPEDARWITKDNVSEVVVQSDRITIYHDYARKLVEMQKAYVCTCDPDTFRTLIFDKRSCPCRDLSLEEQKSRFSNMFSSYKPGEAVLRLKTDIEHKNPAMRDFPLMRINDHVHPRQKDKHKVWPLMNLSVFVDDLEMGVTHALRAKDHMDNAKRQEILYSYFKKTPPVTIFAGRLNFKGLQISCSKTRLLIEEGKYSGWDDARLPFLRALKRRGYQPEAFIRYATEVGITQNDKTVEGKEFFKSLDNFNKDIIDKTSKRYFFIKDPVSIDIKGSKDIHAELLLHPEDKSLGTRKFDTTSNFYVERSDIEDVKEGEIVRLMDLLNFKKADGKLIFDSLSYEDFKGKGKKIIHWLPFEDTVDTKIMMPDNTIVKGIAEKGILSLKQDEIVQFERFGFCRLDNKDDNLFWYAHK